VVPVKTSVLSEIAADVAVVNDRYPADSDPRTSSVELGEAVPIPTWAKLCKANTQAIEKIKLFFIVDCFG
jgi:hypothetical protein